MNFGAIGAGAAAASRTSALATVIARQADAAAGKRRGARLDEGVFMRHHYPVIFFPQIVITPLSVAIDPTQDTIIRFAHDLSLKAGDTRQRCAYPTPMFARDALSGNGEAVSAIDLDHA
jgi:hypothetical protein